MSNRYRRFTEVEDELIMTSEKLDVEIAAILGRRVDSVRQRRMYINRLPGSVIRRKKLRRKSNATYRHEYYGLKGYQGPNSTPWSDEHVKRIMANTRPTDEMLSWELQLTIKAIQNLRVKLKKSGWE
jgi:hypothetical protein